MHFDQSDAVIGGLIRQNIKFIYFKPKEENQNKYRVEFWRFIEAIECRRNFHKISIEITNDNLEADWEIPIWMALLIAEELGDLGIQVP